MKLERVIIFSGKKQKVKEITRSLKQMNVNCGEMHSDLSQAERDEIMFAFKAGSIDVLVATDIVSRGIDRGDIVMVINYDVPHDVEDYVHRIGRTARAERDGVAITLVSDDETYLFKKIEEFLEKEIHKNPLPAGLSAGPEYKVSAKKNNTHTHNKRRQYNKNSDKGKHNNKTNKTTNKNKTKNDRKSKPVRTQEKRLSHDSGRKAD